MMPGSREPHRVLVRPLSDPAPATATVRKMIGEAVSLLAQASSLLEQES
jgi:hypothetical protein